MAVFELPFTALARRSRSGSLIAIAVLSYQPITQNVCAHACSSITCRPSYVMLANLVYLVPVYTYIHVAVRSIAEAREQLVLYAVPGSIWPTDSLLDKFRRLFHRNEVHYTCPAGYCGKPKSLGS